MTPTLKKAMDLAMPETETELEAPTLYVCAKWLGLSIGEIVKFEDGWFEATTEEQKRLIESRDYYGIHIFPWAHTRDGINPVFAASVMQHGIGERDRPFVPQTAAEAKIAMGLLIAEEEQKAIAEGSALDELENADVKPRARQGMQGTGKRR